MKNLKSKLAIALTFILMLSMVITMAPPAAAQIPERETVAYLSVNPYLLGVGQQLLVNLWIYPSPATRTFKYAEQSFKNVTVTFTKPDGSQDSFLPLEPGAHVEPGETEILGSIWFHYYPDQVGTWTVSFNFPGQILGEGDDSVHYQACTSPPTTFTVQQDPVQIGLPPVDLPGPNDYYEYPITADYREWSTILGPWYKPQYDYGWTNHNPYSRAPESPHILWTREWAAGGIIGGLWGSVSWPGAPAASPLIMMGRAFYNMPGGVFHCVDLQTGELIYEKPGQVDAAQNIRQKTAAVSYTRTEIAVEQYAALAPTPYLWQFGRTQWKMYDPVTGSVVRTFNNVPNLQSGTFYGPLLQEGNPIFYCHSQTGWNTTIFERLAVNQLYKWDLFEATGDDWTTGVVWNVSMKQPDGTGPGEGGRSSGLHLSADGSVVAVLSMGEDFVYGFNTTTGELEYKADVGFRIMGALVNAYGLIPQWDSVGSQVHGIDAKTGNTLWVSDKIGTYPWGVQTRVRSAAYGMLYLPDYDGIHAINATTGKYVWTFKFGETTETPFNTWAFYAAPTIADGKLYGATGEHSPSNPRIRGNKVYCVDAFTGDLIWSMSGAMAAGYRGGSIAENVFLGGSENDGLLYAIAKGKTETTVEAPLTAVAAGQRITIRGSVMDMSPAQPGTPAIADEDMGAWMNYLHNERPVPMTPADGESWGTPVDVNGVPVKLIVVHPDGNVEWIYTRTTDMYGNFAHSYEPPTEGIYKIIATFDGSKSYWPSAAETAISVTPGSSPAQQFGWQELAEAPITTEVAIIAAVAVVAVIGVAAFWILRKRK